jgi:hypothetical protein
MFRSYTPRHRVPKQRSPRRGLVGIVTLAVSLILSLTLAPSANAGLGDVEITEVVGQWEALDTDDGTGNPYPGTWSTEAIVSPSFESGFDSALEAHLTWNAASGTGTFEGEFSPNLGTSLEIADLNQEIPAGTDVSVGWHLSDGATYVAGAPRIFVEIDGTYYNSFGNEWSDESGGAIFGLPAGTVGHVGIVYDNGVPGTVNVHGPFRFFNDGELHVLFPSAPTTPTEANAFGKEVSAYVKENGGPPPHANAKASQG